MSKIVVRIVAGLLAVACSAGLALAQNNFPTVGGSRAPGAVMMCLDAQGRAVPVTVTSNPCPTGSGGGGGGDASAANQVTEIASLASILAAINSPGAVTQSTSPWVIDTGVTGNLVTLFNSPLPAGTNDVGLFGPNAALTALFNSPIPTQATSVPIGGVGLIASASPVTGATRGATFPLDVQIRDASGNQITSFGSSAPIADCGATPCTNKIGLVGPSADLTALFGTATPAGENHMGAVGTNAAIVGCNFTRPADTTAYASGDLVANSTTAGSVVPCTIAVSRVNDSSVFISRVRLIKNGTSVTLAVFKVHLYKDSPTVTNGDNAAWLSTESTYLGCFDITVDKAFSNGSKGIGVPCNGTFVTAVPSAGTKNIFALIEARAAYAPASAEIFALTLETIQN